LYVVHITVVVCIIQCAGVQLRP